MQIAVRPLVRSKACNDVLYEIGRAIRRYIEELRWVRTRIGPVLGMMTEEQQRALSLFNVWRMIAAALRAGVAYVRDKRFICNTGMVPPLVPLSLVPEGTVRKFCIDVQEILEHREWIADAIRRLRRSMIDMHDICEVPAL